MSNETTLDGDETLTVPPIENLAAQTESPATPVLLQRHEFPRTSLVPENDLDELQTRHEEFVASLAGRLSIYLGLEVDLRLAKFETVTYRKFVEATASPTHLTVLKMEPLNGNCVIDLSSRLALALVDRELGGAGVAGDEPRELGKMEMRLLSKIIEIIAAEWGFAWRDLAEIRSSQLRHESNARSLQICSPESSMLALVIETKLGELTEQMQLAFPHSMLEPLLRKLNADHEPGGKLAAAPTHGKPQWNKAFDEIEVRLTAELPDVEVTARQLAELKPGDVISVQPQMTGQVLLCLAGAPKFTCKLGTTDGQWAVQLAEPLR